MPSEIFIPGMLDGKVALVTGGGTGLGRAAAAELLACGARVVIAGRRQEVLEASAQRLGEGCSALPGDIREPEQAAALVEKALDRHGRLDILVNNAGGQYFTPAEATPLKGWRAVMRLNVEGTANMTAAAVERALRPGGGGAIVNITLSPHHGLAGMTHSSAARAIVEQLTRDWAREYASDGITVAAVAVGHFETDALEKYPASVKEGAARIVPLGRLGRPVEHAWLVALLCSPLAGALSGQVVTIDGARDNHSGPWPPESLGGETGDVPIETRKPAATK